MLIEYYSNNSGGGDWLNEKQWAALEVAGWRIFGFDNFVYEDNRRKKDEEGVPIRKGIIDRPKYAFKKFDTLDQAIGEWERVTGESSYDTGCETCGDPHSFSSEEN